MYLENVNNEDIMWENVMDMAEQVIDCLRMARTAQLLSAGNEWSRANIIARREAANRMHFLNAGDPIRAVLMHLECSGDCVHSSCKNHLDELVNSSGGVLDLRA